MLEWWFLDFWDWVICFDCWWWEMICCFICSYGGGFGLVFFFFWCCLLVLCWVWCWVLCCLGLWIWRFFSRVVLMRKENRFVCYFLLLLLFCSYLLVFIVINWIFCKWLGGGLLYFFWVLYNMSLRCLCWCFLNWLFCVGLIDL